MFSPEGPKSVTSRRTSTANTRGTASAVSACRTPASNAAPRAAPERNITRFTPERVQLRPCPGGLLTPRAAFAEHDAEDPGRAKRQQRQAARLGHQACI